jgi:hypothetical protein
MKTSEPSIASLKVFLSVSYAKASFSLLKFLLFVETTPLRSTKRILSLLKPSSSNKFSFAIPADPAPAHTILTSLKFFS